MTATMTAQAGDRFDVVCVQHDYYRHGITQQHAFNAVNRHNADHHAQPVLATGHLANLVIHHHDQAEQNPEDPDAETRAENYLAAWCTLTGLTGVRALNYARDLDFQATAHHSPF